ncbi:MAG: hypothetical protein ACOC07_16655, partial [Coleofasciculus sp.]|uniref:hypothetical protein n=1 Tax=Coleofasciculus sp. TaxID=3100458 RepID=UPI003A23E3B6
DRIEISSSPLVNIVNYPTLMLGIQRGLPTQKLADEPSESKSPTLSVPHQRGKRCTRCDHKNCSFLLEN